MAPKVSTSLCIVAVLGLIGSRGVAHAQGPVTFYVATNGNDASSGRSPDPGAGTDGPFATVQRARDAIRVLKGQQGGSLRQPVTVAIRAGTYFLSQTLVLQPQDSGTADAPITYAAYANERPVLSGGRRITGWRPVTIDGTALWAADVPEVRAGGWYFRQLWVNGQRRTRARHPNQGLLRIAALPDATADWLQGQNRFQYAPGDIKPWRRLTDVEVVLYSMWVSARLPIASVDEGQRMVTFDRSTDIRMTESSFDLIGAPYRVENAFEFLDAPGEWYLDRDSGTVYYLPMPGDDPGSADVIAPNLTRLMQFQGNRQAGTWVEYVNVRNLTFSNTDWYFPPGNALDASRAGSSLYFGAVWGDMVRHARFEGLTVAHTGAHALQFMVAADITVTACDLYDLGAGGVFIGPSALNTELPRSQGNEVADCHVRDGGKVFEQASGIALFQTRGSRIVHNWVHDFGESGISLNGTLGYGLSLTGDNLVELNHVHHIGVRSNGAGSLLNDLGGIYMVGERPGTKVRRNLVHDIAASRYAGRGLYLDEGTTGVLAEHNIVYRATDGVFNLHYGRDNVVRNNIFALSARTGAASNPPGQIQKGIDGGDPQLQLTFDTNIVYWRQGTLLGSFPRSFTTGGNVAFDRNVYWRDGGNTTASSGAVSWDSWQASGMDRNSVIADPLFVAPDQGDFRLTSASPALALGFQPIDLTGVGPRSPSTNVDSDVDTLPDAWERQFGLNPNSTLGADGASGDFDADGVTNLSEYQAGTDPTLPNVWNLPEGATGFFTERIAVANPGADAATFAVTFLPETGAPITQSYTLGAQRRMTIPVNDVAGLSNAAVSAVVSTTRGGVVVERTMMWDGRDGSHYGGHTGKAIPQARTTWYLAEGEANFFDTYILLANANSGAAAATLSFLLENGNTITQPRTVGANARVTVYANDVPGLRGNAFSTTITSDVPITVERAMYFGNSVRTFNGGHEAAAIAAPSTSWFVAEGRTGPFFDMYLLLANPGTAAATATITFLTPGGGTVVQTRTLNPTSRTTIHVDGVPGLTDTDVSASIVATQPIIVERAMYWPDPFTNWYEAHSSAGVTTTGVKWALAEGEIGGALGFETYILLANPTAAQATVTLTFLRASAAPVSVIRNVSANGRLTVSAGDAGLASGEQFGVLVESTQPIAVERSLYWNGGGQTWGAGTNETGVRIR